MKQHVTVLGVQLTVNTTSTDPLYLQDVAKHVEETAARIVAGTPGLPVHKVAVMTALEIADELFRNSSSAVPESRRAPARIEALAEKIEKALGEKG